MDLVEFLLGVGGTAAFVAYWYSHSKPYVEAYQQRSKYKILSTLTPEEYKAYLEDRMKSYETSLQKRLGRQRLI